MASKSNPPKIIIYASNIDCNVTNIFNEFFYDDITICPFCQDVSALFHKLQWMDFTGHEMLSCARCCAQSLILRDTAKIINITQLKETLPQNKIDEMLSEYNKSCHNTATRRRGKHPRKKLQMFYTFSLAKILRVSNRQCYSYKISHPGDFTATLNSYFIKGIARIINEYMQFSLCDMHDFMTIDGYCKTGTSTPEFDTHQKSKELMMQVFNIHNSYDVLHYDFYGASDNCSINQYFWNMSLAVDSYNLSAPRNPYPKCFELFDGVSNAVHLLCLGRNGDEFSTAYNEE